MDRNLAAAATSLIERVAVALADATGDLGKWTGVPEATRRAVRAEAAHLVTTFGKHGLFLVTAENLRQFGQGVTGGTGGKGQTVRGIESVPLVRETGQEGLSAAAGPAAVGALDIRAGAYEVPQEDGGKT